MRAHDLIEALEEAVHDEARRVRVVHLVHLAAEDLRGTAYAHDQFRPAAREWREDLRRRRSRSHLRDQARRLRERRGGGIGQLHLLQRDTFEDAVRVICPDDLGVLGRPQVLDHLWYLFVRIEKRVRAAGRDEV